MKKETFTNNTVHYYPYPKPSMACNRNTEQEDTRRKSAKDE